MALLSGKQTFAATEWFRQLASRGLPRGTDINHESLSALLGLNVMGKKAAIDHKICWYEREMDDKTRQRNMMAADIRRSKPRPGVSLHLSGYPQHSKIVASPTTRRCCAGSIRSWGRSLPDVFIPIAEESSAIVPSSYWAARAGVCNESGNGSEQKSRSISLRDGCAS